MLHLLRTFLQLVVLMPLNADRSLHLIHVTDIRSQFEQTEERLLHCREGQKCFGGFARVAAFIKDRKRENSLSFSVGDVFYDSLAFSIFRQQPAVKYMKLMDFDALSLGHHDFEFGYDPFKKFVNKVKIPIVGCNLLDVSPEQATVDKILKHKQFRVANLTVGVIGYFSSSAKLPGYCDRVRIVNLIPALKYCVKLAKGHGADVIIALGQASVKEDVIIANLVDGIDIIIGSREKTFLYNGRPPSFEKPEGKYPKVVKKANGGKVLILYSYRYTKYIGEITVRWSDDLKLISYEGNSVLLDDKFREDPKVLAMHLKVRAKLDQYSVKKVGKTLVNLHGRDCRTKECNFGNLITDAMREYAITSNTRMRDNELFPITLINSGVMKRDFETHKTGGVLTVGILKRVMPLDSRLIYLKLDGKSILKIFEYSLQRSGSGGFLQMSGARIFANIDSTGVTLVKAEVEDKFSNFEPIRKHRIYDVVTTGFILAGGDNYFFFEKAEIVKKYKGATVMWVLQNFIKMNYPVKPTVEGRITLRFQESAVSTGNERKFSTCLQIWLFIWLLNGKLIK